MYKTLRIFFALFVSTSVFAGESPFQTVLEGIYSAEIGRLNRSADEFAKNARMLSMDASVGEASWLVREGLDLQALNDPTLGSIKPNTSRVLSAISSATADTSDSSLLTAHEALDLLKTKDKMLKRLRASGLERASLLKRFELKEKQFKQAEARVMSIFSQITKSLALPESKKTLVAVSASAAILAFLSGKFRGTHAASTKPVNYMAHHEAITPSVSKTANASLSAL
jgi:hypothetical protein